MNNKIDISIVIVNYNVKDYLLQCLRSIYNSAINANFEVIIVDNNSHDNSIPFLRKRFPQVEYIELNENIGFGRANNLGFKKAKGEYILILNPDSTLEKNTLQLMLDYMRANPECGMASCKALNPDGSFQPACRRGFPTPWAAFCKLFGLQALFPKSKLFGKYNQTFRSVDEQSPVDSIAGSFMFSKADLINKLGGFDPDFFMYGEDLDLCYRVWASGSRVDYVPSAQYIHYKGESARRSDIDEIKRFYEAMVIYAEKRYRKNSFLLLLLKLGISFRSSIARLLKYKSKLAFAIFDVLVLNSVLLLSTHIKFGRYFGFPSYAYPLVFIVITSILLLNSSFFGDYFEEKSSSKKTFLSFMTSFFVLSSLTYFFKNFAFSRGIVLATIVVTMIFSLAARAISGLIAANNSKKRKTRLAFIGMANRETLDYIRSRSEIQYIGRVKAEKENNEENIIGSIEFLSKIIKDNDIDELIISGEEASDSLISNVFYQTQGKAVKIYFENEYEDIVASKVVSELADDASYFPKPNLSKLKQKFSKRASDIILSLLALTIGSPYSIYKGKYRDLVNTICGKYSFIGVKQTKIDTHRIAKIGLLSLADTTDEPESLSDKAIEKLNQYYERNYSVSLDINIIIKYFFHRSRKK